MKTKITPQNIKNNLDNFCVAHIDDLYMRYRHSKPSGFIIYFGRDQNNRKFAGDMKTACDIFNNAIKTGIL